MVTERGMRLILTFESGGVGWRHPRSNAENLLNLDYYSGIAAAAEHASIDAIFRADVPYLYPDTIGSTASAGIEPLTLLSAIAARTENIGVIATASTTFKEPYDLARTFATLDHISGGRTGWNMVTSAFGERNFGIEKLPSQEERYARAEEFLAVAKSLWSSWPREALLVDRASGRYADESLVQPIAHSGSHFSVEGPLDIPQSPQGEPVLVQAGSSGVGRGFAARHADVVFTAAQDLVEASEFRNDIRSLARTAGRAPDSILVLPGVKTIVGSTEKAAQNLLSEIRECIDYDEGRHSLEKAMGFVSLSGLSLDETIPSDRLNFASNDLRRRQSRPELFRRLALEKHYTVRELIQEHIISSGHRIVAGSAESVADDLAHWFQLRAADGFIVIPAAANTDAFLEGVVPILQKRGLFRKEYRSSTLRATLGLRGRP